MATRRTFIQQVAAASVVTASSDGLATPPAAEDLSPPRKTGMRTYNVPHTDLVVSRIAYGCASLTGWDKAPVSTGDIIKAARVIHTAYENGITLFDHADLYAFGKAEQVFGEVMKQSPGLRNRIVIQSKCGQRFPDEWQQGDPIRADLSREHIVSSVEGSLRRLGTDRLDILLLHVADALMEPDEIAQAFGDLNRAGKVRYFGVSNYNAAQLQLLRKSVHQPIVVNQIQLGLAHSYPLADGMEFTLQITKGVDADRGYRSLAGAGTLDYCRLNEIQIQAWSPLRGVLNPQAEAKPEVKQAAQLLADLAKQKETTPSAIALAWLLRHPARIAPVIGSPEPEHIVENCAATNVTLSRDEWYKLFATSTDLQSLVT